MKRLLPRHPPPTGLAAASPPALSLAGLLLAAGVSCWLVACSTPGSPPSPRDRAGGSPAVPLPAPRGADGPPEQPVPDLHGVPDAEPRVEPIRSGGANKPYEVLGRSYVPLARDEPVIERGLASWYGRKFHGRRTASGEVYNMLAMTAAHKTMPIPSYARVRNPANGREVVVRVNDRGPFSSNRIIDLSYTAAVKLGVQGGVKMVEVQRITNEEIRAGLAPRGDTTESAQASPEIVAAAGPVSIGPAATPAPLAPAGAETQANASPGLPAIAASLPTTAQLPGPAPERSRAYTPAAAGFWLQLGAFGRGDGAYTFQQRVGQELGWLVPLLTVFADGGLHRLQAGPYPTRDQAREVAERVRSALQLVPVIVERR
ncbi:MAG TPA: septal ring lytic transglycosylase RlpA family protein [Ideonella sp.]|nr:septal ring lytic transglycosylase RlpA family protein [Ideonella sp.]